MGEFWYGTDLVSQLNPWGNVIRIEASAAHIYGRPIVQAESFTSWKQWQDYPEALKSTGDQAFLDGLNRMAFHQYTAQPMVDMKPGWQYGAGTHFDRNITWWQEARGFFDYIARCQYLLQKGLFQADALCYYGEGTSKFVPSPEYLHPTLPKGYNFDAINTELVMDGLKIENGRWTLPSGMSYRVLVLPEDGIISPGVLEKIRSLVEEGGIVVGRKPERTPGLEDFPGSEQRPSTSLGQQKCGGNVDGVKVKERDLGQSERSTRKRIRWRRSLAIKSFPKTLVIALRIRKRTSASSIAPTRMEISISFQIAPIVPQKLIAGSGSQEKHLKSGIR